MPRNRIYRVLIILLVASTSRAGWNTNIWNLANEYANDPWKPAITNSANITNGTPLAVNIIETNLYAICVTDVITRISTTNYIPAITRITATIPFLSSAGALEFNSHATNIYCWTNTYYTNVSYGGTSVMGVAGSTNYSYSTNFVYNGETNFTTTTVSRVNVGGVYSFRLDADDQRTYEIFAAINEREAAIRGTNASFLAGRMFGDRYMANMWDGGTYYGGTFDNLSQAKQWIFNNVTNFANIANAQSTTNSNYDFLPYLSGTNVTYTFYYGSLNHSNGWDTNYTTRTSIPSWTAKELLKHVGAPLNWFGSLSVSVTTNERSQSATFEEMVLVVSNHPIYNIFYTVQTNITPSYAANSYKQYGRDLTGIGFPFSYAVTSAITVIRYPDSKWIIPTGYVTYVTNGITNRWVGYVTNFAYTYNPNEIITNVMHLWDGTVTNVTGTNGQRVTWTNYPASQPYIGYPDSVVSLAGSESVSVTNIDAYGLKYMTNILSQLVVLHGDVSWSTSAVQVLSGADRDFVSYIGVSAEDYIDFVHVPISEGAVYIGASFFESNNITGNYRPRLERDLEIDDQYGGYTLSSWDTWMPRIAPATYYQTLYSNQIVECSREIYTYLTCSTRVGSFGPVWSSGTVEYGFEGYELTRDVAPFWGDDSPWGMKELPWTNVSCEGCTVDIYDTNLGFSKLSFTTNASTNAFYFTSDWVSSVPWDAYTTLFISDNEQGLEGDCDRYKCQLSIWGLAANTSSGTVFTASPSSECEEYSDGGACGCSGSGCSNFVGCVWGKTGMVAIENLGWENNHMFDGDVYWDFVSVRNYAVPNGFKYY